jgi:anti-anti-sigma factor
MKLVLNEEKVGSVALVSFEGPLDSAGAIRAEQKLEELVAAGERWLLFDFERLTQMGSEGARFLLSAHKKVLAQEGKLGVCRVCFPVMEALKIAGLDKVLHLCPSKEEALALLCPH